MCHSLISLCSILTSTYFNTFSLFSGLIEVIHTIDGKEYLTPNQLEREIRDELVVHGGRINLVDLQQIIHVDLSHIETKVNEIVHRDRFYNLIQGELLDKDYLDRLAEEINESLQESGQVMISDLAKSFDLPTEFIYSVIEPRIDIIIHGQIDPLNRNTLYTKAFIAHNIAKVRGICSGVMKPVQIIQLAAQYGISEKLILNVLETLITSQRLSGSIQGGKEKATYIPDIYSTTQKDYIDSFLRQNNYIEYQQLSKLGIANGKEYIKKRYADRKDFIYLLSCCVSDVIIDQIDAAIEEAVANNSWVDVQPLTPSPLATDDINQLLQRCLKGHNRTTTEVFCDHIVSSKQFISKCKSVFDQIMTNKATNDIKTSPSFFAELTKKEKTDLTDAGTGEGKQSRRDERQKKANAGTGQKGGGGRGSRESGTKKTKNKYHTKKGHDDDMDDSNYTSNKKPTNSTIEFMTEEQILEVLESNFPDASYDLLTEISSNLRRVLAHEYQEIAKSIFVASTQVSSSSSKKKVSQDYREKLNGLMTNIRLFEKGLNSFEGDTAIVLVKHLLKTVGTEVVNIIFEMVATENLMSLSDNEEFTPETRLKLLKSLPENWKSALTKLNSSLTAKGLEDFYNNVDVMTGQDYCDIPIKKVDKKKERQLLFNHRQCLMDQLEREMDPPMALHLTVVILFQYHTNTLLHGPGRCVPQVIGYLQPQLSRTNYYTLIDYQDLVIKQLGGKSSFEDIGMLEGESNEDEGKSVSVLLSERLDNVKNIAKNMKKVQHGE